MASTRRLDDMRSDIRVAADIVNQTNRHPNSQLTRWINESIQRFREKVCSAGNWYFATSSDATVTAGSPGVTLSGTPEIVRVLGVDIIDEGRAHTLFPLSPSERNDFGGLQGPGSDVRSLPACYIVMNDGTIGVAPVPDANYNLVVWYLPFRTDLVNDSDEFDGIAGWEDWVRWDVCCKVAVRDRNMELYQMAKDERARIETEMLTMAPRLQQSYPIRRVDTRGRREGALDWRERRLPS